MISFYSILLLLLLSPLSSGSYAVVSSDVNLQSNKLQVAYVVFQAWKKVINSDPQKITANWVGLNVCSYTGVFCAPATYNPNITVVAGIDLNKCDIGGFLPSGIGYLVDLAILHLHSNRFSGVIPNSVSRLKLLFELDVGDNQLVGPFPTPVLDLPSLSFLDLRFNNLEGPLPPKLFDMPLDAIILNSNQFNSTIPSNMGNSNASLIVLANNKFSRRIPSNMKNMGATLDELVLSNNTLTGCLPPEIAQLSNTTVINISENQFSGKLPAMGEWKSVEEVDVSRNKMVGEVPDWICESVSLKSFEFEVNFFNRIGKSCEEARKRGVVLSDTGNCLEGLNNQRDGNECKELVGKPVVCNI